MVWNVCTLGVCVELLHWKRVGRDSGVVGIYDVSKEVEGIQNFFRNHKHQMAVCRRDVKSIQHAMQGKF